MPNMQEDSLQDGGRVRRMRTDPASTKSRLRLHLCPTPPSAARAGSQPPRLTGTHTQLPQGQSERVSCSSQQSDLFAKTILFRSLSCSKQNKTKRKLCVFFAALRAKSEILRKACQAPQDPAPPRSSRLPQGPGAGWKGP